MAKVSNIQRWVPNYMLFSPFIKTAYLAKKKEEEEDDDMKELEAWAENI